MCDRLVPLSLIGHSDWSFWLVILIGHFDRSFRLALLIGYLYTYTHCLSGIMFILIMQQNRQIAGSCDRHSLFTIAYTSAVSKKFWCGGSSFVHEEGITFGSLQWKAHKQILKEALGTIVCGHASAEKRLVSPLSPELPVMYLLLAHPWMGHIASLL